jgi:DNA polymerase III epsilon subunit-like protein
MCVTDTSDHAVVSAALVGKNGEIVFDVLIKPEGNVLDYKSSIHGITAEVLKVRSLANCRTGCSASVLREK